jgi:hypothetical protein
MMVSIPGENRGEVWRSTNKQAGLWQPSKADLDLFLNGQSSDAPLFITHSDDAFKP